MREYEYKVALRIDLAVPEVNGIQHNLSSVFSVEVVLGSHVDRSLT